MLSVARLTLLSMSKFHGPSLPAFDYARFNLQSPILVTQRSSKIRIPRALPDTRPIEELSKSSSEAHGQLLARRRV